jgi:DNA-binding NarL/FixJ family response regulator
MRPTPIHVVIVDDHRLLRAEIAQIIQNDLRLAVIGEAGDGEQAVELVRRLYPDVVLMDVQMPKMNGIEATRQSPRLCPEVAVIGLSLSHHAEAMVEAGASAYLSKQHIVEELCPTIRRVNEGYWSQAWQASPHNLLLIDDDAVFLKTVSDALQDEHPDLLIETVSSAVQGLRLLNLRRFDAIVSDFRMAGLNGIDLLKECQADSVRIPVVLMTGYGTPALEQDAFEQGACAILQKPLDPEQLYDAVTRAIRRTKWLGEVKTQQLAHRRDQLSVRIQELDQRLQDTLKRNDSSQEY